MVCIYCRSATKVSNSRPQKRLYQVWRRRTCLQCGATFTTFENVELGTSLVVKHPDGRTMPFSRDKLFISIYRAVGHRQNPIGDARALTTTITARLLQHAESAAITPIAITHSTLQVLKHFDKVAAVQYGAYHPI